MKSDSGSASGAERLTPLVKDGRVVWKFPLTTTDYQEIEIPAGAHLLTIQTQAGNPQLWALVDPDAMPICQSFYTHGTGHAVSERAGSYIGSYQLYNGSLIFHVFTGAEQPPAAERTQ